MGGTVSTGRSNDELVDNLVEGYLIKTPLIERVFRCIDRGLYYTPSSKDSAYRDLAWRDGNIHISAPCIYTRVMENLELKENLSFLNIGSGTGYLSSMVGLLIGPNGVNHNIELHKDLIDYAKQKAIEFVNTAPNFDHFDFCVPKFVHGNCMNLTINSDTLQYDRIYVGAGVTDQEEQFLISYLLKIDGILLMPLNDSLVKIKRLDEKSFSKKSFMTVSFASLTMTNTAQTESFSMPRLNPLSLQELCRFRIRQQIRHSIESEHSDYYEIHRAKSTFNKTGKISSNSLDDQESSSDDDDNESSESSERLRIFERLISNHRNTFNTDYSVDNRLKVMVYGHALDAATSLDPSYNQTSLAELSEPIEISEIFENNEEEEDEQMLTSDELIAAAAALKEVTESVERQEATNSIPIIEPNLANSDLNNLASSIESIEDQSSEQITSATSNMLAIGYIKRPINRRIRQVSSGYQSTSTDLSTSLTDNIKLNSNELSEENSDHYFDDDNDDDDYDLDTNVHHLKSVSINSNDNLNRNLLRERVMQLPVSGSLKEFLLYYRKI